MRRRDLGVLRDDDHQAPAPDADVIVHALPQPYELPALVVLSRDLRVMVRPYNELHLFRSGEFFRADAEIVAFVPNAFDPVDGHLRRAAA